MTYTVLTAAYKPIKSREVKIHGLKFKDLVCIFHEWGVDRGVTVGVIEIPDGSVRLIHPELITFI